MQCWFISNVENLWYFFQDCLLNKKLNKNSIYLKYNFISNVENLWYFFQDSLMNKKLNKNSIYLKYNFCNNIH